MLTIIIYNYLKYYNRVIRIVNINLSTISWICIIVGFSYALFYFWEFKHILTMELKIEYLVMIKQNVATI